MQVVRKETIHQWFPERFVSFCMRMKNKGELSSAFKPMNFLVQFLVFGNNLAVITFQKQTDTLSMR